MSTLKSLAKLTSSRKLRSGHRLFRPIYALRYLISSRLSVELNHGLANRLITLASCQLASKHIGKKFRYTWNVNEHCGSEFSDLFENNINLHSDVLCFDYNDDATFKPAFLNKSKSQFFSSYNFNLLNKGSLDNWTIHNIPFINGLIDDAATAFHRELNVLQPTSNVLTLIPPLQPNAIGVHIRRGDLPWQDRSPIELFQLAMDKLLNHDPAITFFLATDSQDIRSLMKMRYGPRIQSLSCINLRNTSLGVQIALADLLTLSRTSLILGTYNSSFSWLASAWGLVNLQIIGI